MPSRETQRQSIDVDAVFDLLSDPYATEILSILGDGPTTAIELADRCNGSRVTVYRRLNRLEDAGLVSCDTRIRRDGNHCGVYRLAVRELTVTLTEDGFEAECRP